MQGEKNWRQARHVQRSGPRNAGARAVPGGEVGGGGERRLSERSEFHLRRGNPLRGMAEGAQAAQVRINGTLWRLLHQDCELRPSTCATCDRREREVGGR